MENKQFLYVKFSELTPSEQRKIRLFMGGMALNNIIFFAFIPPKLWAVLLIGILLNAVMLYWSIYIKQAMTFYYRFIIWAFWVAIVFDGAHVISVLFKFPHIEVSAIGSFINIILVIVFSRSVLNYRKLIAMTSELK